MSHRASELAGSCEHGDEPSASIEGGNFLDSWVTISFSRRSLFCGVNYPFAITRDLVHRNTLNCGIVSARGENSRVVCVCVCVCVLSAHHEAISVPTHLYVFFFIFVIIWNSIFLISYRTTWNIQAYFLSTQTIFRSCNIPLSRYWMRS
jgi:hypothetical protein